MRTSLTNENVCHSSKASSRAVRVHNGTHVTGGIRSQSTPVVIPSPYRNRG